MLKKVLRSAVAPALLFALAVGLIGYGGVKAVAAAPRIQSNWYGAEVVLTNIQTAIVENEVVVEGNDVLLLDSFRTPNGIGANGEGFEIGKVYDEVLKVENINSSETGIPQYVRVTVTKYWPKVNEKGEVLYDSKGKPVKDTTLDPAFIQLHFVEGNGWTIDPAASTEERTVLYYSGILNPGDRSTEFVDKLSISTDTLTKIETVPSGNEYYTYDGRSFYIDATVDAVQTHNGQEAMTGAWGRTN